MPVLDWTRTSLDYELEDGAKALRFDTIAFAAFELYILKRPGAIDTYSDSEKKAASAYFELLSENDKTKLSDTIIAGLPGSRRRLQLKRISKDIGQVR